MRKKRKLRARADAEVEHATDMETPELIEALEAAEVAKDLPEAEESLEEQEERRRKLSKILESLLFASDKPLTVPRFKQLTGEKDLDRIKEALEQLARDYEGRGIVLHDVAGGWQLRTAPDTAEWVQQLVAGRPVRLTRAQLETLAIIAYRQPITRPEIDEIRGVDSGGTLKLLLDRSLVRVLGKKEEPGRPILYGTTKEFLEFFNLAALKDLPTLREYHELTEDSMRTVEEKLGVTAEEAQETAREQRQAAEEAAAAKAAAESATEQAMEAAEAAGEVDGEAAEETGEAEVEAAANDAADDDEADIEAAADDDEADVEAAADDDEAEVEAAADPQPAADVTPPPPDESPDEPSPPASV